MYNLEKKEDNIKLFKDFFFKKAIILVEGKNTFEGGFVEAEKEYKHYVVANNNRKRLTNLKN